MEFSTEHKRREIFAELKKRAEELKTNPLLSVLQASPALTIWLVHDQARQIEREGRINEATAQKHFGIEWKKNQDAVK